MQHRGSRGRLLRQVSGGASAANIWLRRARSAVSERLQGKRRIWVALRICLSLGLLAYVVGQIELGRVLDLVVGLRFELLAPALVLVLLNRVLAAYRWYILLCGKHASVAFWPVLRLVLVSGFVGSFVPGTVGVEALRIYGLARAGVAMSVSVTSVMAERMMALMTLALLGLIGLLSQPVVQLPELTWLVSLGLVALVGATIAVMHPMPRRLTLLLVAGRLPTSVHRGLAKVYAVLDEYRAQPGLMLWSGVITLVFQLLHCVTPAFAAAALGIAVPITFFFLAMPILFLLLMAPISIAGLGVLEVGFVYLFGLTGVPPAAALSLALLTRLLWASTLVPGAWLYARRGL